MLSYFIPLEWKAFLRSASFGKNLVIRLLMGFFVIYMLASLLMLGVGMYFIIQKAFPGVEPLQFLNGYLVYWVLFELLMRYFMQKLPVMNIKPFLTLPVSKNKMAHYVLAKSSFSYFNFIGLFAFLPFAVVLLAKGYSALNVLAWLSALVGVTLLINYLNFIVNKSDRAFIIIAMSIASIAGLDHFGILPIAECSRAIFHSLYTKPWLAIVPWLLAAGTYCLNFNFLRGNIFLDAGLKKKTKSAETSELGWTRRFGDMAPFLQMDLRLIWRNKRTKTQVFVSLAMVLYGLIFYTSAVYEEMFAMKVFVGIFITGIFLANFGQFIPAWDSEYYSMLMAQNIPLRQYLESKYLLIAISIAFMFVISIPYVYFGWHALWINLSTAVYNLGVNIPLILFFGGFNKKRIDLTKSPLGNMQGTSAVQFLVIIPLLGAPMIIFSLVNFLVSFNAAAIVLSTIGILALFFRNFFMEKITQLYRSKKYGMIAGFKQANN